MTDGRKEALLETVAGVEQILHAIRFGQKFAPVKRVDKDLRGRRLKPDEEMPGHADPDNG